MGRVVVYIRLINDDEERGRLLFKKYLRRSAWPGRWTILLLTMTRGVLLKMDRGGGYVRHGGV
jgi:hypothetical protein